MQQLMMIATLCRCGEEAIANYSFSAAGKHFSLGLCEQHWRDMLSGPDRPLTVPVRWGENVHG